MPPERIKLHLNYFLISDPTVTELTTTLHPNCGLFASEQALSKLMQVKSSFSSSLLKAPAAACIINADDCTSNLAFKRSVIDILWLVMYDDNAGGISRALEQAAFINAGTLPEMGNFFPLPIHLLSWRGLSSGVSRLI